MVSEIYDEFIRSNPKIENIDSFIDMKFNSVS